MPKPKFTDKHRYRTPYVNSQSTNVAETFRRIREENAKNEAERKVKVEPIRRKA
jgi:hypothetical protein